MNYVPIVVATDLEVHFSVLKKGGANTFGNIVYMSTYSTNPKTYPTES